MQSRPDSRADDAASRQDRALRLLMKALRGLNAGADREYGGLLAAYRSEPPLRDAVHAAAESMELVVLDDLRSGLVLGSASSDGPFAPKLEDVRKLGQIDRGVLALALVAIAAAYYPTSVALAAKDPTQLTVAELADRLEAVIRESEAGSEELGIANQGVFDPAWQRIKGRERAAPGKRASLKTLSGTLKILVNYLIEMKLLTPVKAIDDVPVDRPTEALRVQVREMLKNPLAAGLVNRLRDDAANAAQGT